MKKYSLIFLCMFLPCILYAEEASAVINDVKILLDEGTWVPKHYLDVLERKNRDYMSNFVPNIDSFNSDMTEIDRLEGLIPFDSDAPPNMFFWYEHGLLSFEPLKIREYRSENFFKAGYNEIIILDTAYVDDMLKFTSRLGENNYYISTATMLDWSKLTENEEIFDMFFIFDGDYLHVYIDEVLPENLFYTFCRINDATVNEFKTLMASNTCDLSNVTWSRYADGSSDYGNRIITNDTVENHEVGKTYLTTDNLRFRATEGVSGNPLFTLPKDALVTVLKLGKEETIDSITANWLQVKVVENTIDTVGTEVKKGAVGWCFGGYLTNENIAYEALSKTVTEVSTEAEEVLPELESTEKANPITMWLLLGGGVLLLGAVVVVVVVRKKKK